MKKIIVVESSFREKGNSNILAESFAMGAKEAGCSIKIIKLKDIKMGYCTGCMECTKLKRCILNDSINLLLDDIQKADILVFATPIYYYEMSGQLKTFLDRLNPLFSRNNNFKEVYILMSCADSDSSAMDNSINGIKGFVACFDGLKFIKSINATNMTNVGDIKGSSFIKEAYSMGLSIR